MGMSIHSIESFDESESIKLLKDVLESKHTIKTFFGDNEKTPNHDGFFELVDSTLAPRKQFIVQIKKTKKLTPNVKGTNKGKYVYELKTNFLEYVKKKVTESPAIYFVVDIEENRIFWLYLSDEVLMSMNFENREKVSYAFSEDNILSDITSFTTILNKIVVERNKIFLAKSKEEIIAMQDAVDYLNQYLDHDLKAIKDSVFPNLWRFGIKCSDNPGISIGIGQEMKAIDCSGAVALYPQIKGTNDTGIQEYIMGNDNLFNQLALGKQVYLSEYSKSTLNKIIVMFFENGIPAKYLPDIVLFEIINTFTRKSSCFFEAFDTLEISVKEANRRYMLMGKYVQYILSNNSINSQEQSVKQSIINRMNRGQTSFFDIISHRELIPSFLEYCKTNTNSNPIFSPELFLYISKDYFRYLDVLIELEKRKIEIIKPIWDYNWFDICRMSKDDQFNAIENLMLKWVSQLSLIYNETYEKLFRCNDFKTNYKYYFKVKQIIRESTYLGIGYIYQKYKDTCLSIIYDSDFVEESYTDNHADNYISTTHGSDIGSIFKDHTPLFYALSCLLHNGLCEALDFNPQRLNIRNTSYSGGIRFF